MTGKKGLAETADVIIQGLGCEASRASATGQRSKRRKHLHFCLGKATHLAWEGWLRCYCGDTMRGHLSVVVRRWQDEFRGQSLDLWAKILSGGVQR